MQQQVAAQGHRPQQGQLSGQLGQQLPILLSQGSRVEFMDIEKIVEQVLGEGCLTPAMEAEISQICEATTDLSWESYAALDKLMQALLAGTVVVAERKQFINVMEELVTSEALLQVAEIEAASDSYIDVGDIAAYALNRLPPLYATTADGANYQRQRARDELSALIAQRVREAITHHLDRLHVHAGGQFSRKGIEDRDAIKQISNLLQAYAITYEPGSTATGKRPSY